MRKFDVYGVGNAIMDLQLRVSDEDLDRFKLVKGGMKLVEVSEQQDIIEYFYAHDVNQASGGSAANTAIAIAQLGGRVGYGCMVGDDGFGKFYQGEMANLGVSLHVKPRERESTGTCVILITPDAERTMNTHLGASSNFGPEHVSEEHIADARWLYVEGYLFSSEKGQQVVSKAIKVAKRSQTRIAVSFADGFIVDAFREPLSAAVAQADLIFANRNEAAAFAREDDEIRSFAALKSACPNVAMTLHERGARVFYAGEEFFIPAVKTNAIDTTGAGDMFAGGFLYGLTRGWKADKAAELACFLASKVVSQIGPRLNCDVKKLMEMTALS